MEGRAPETSQWHHTCSRFLSLFLTCSLPSPSQSASLLPNHWPGPPSPAAPDQAGVSALSITVATISAQAACRNTDRTLLVSRGAPLSRSGHHVSWPTCQTWVGHEQRKPRTTRRERANHTASPPRLAEDWRFISPRAVAPAGRRSTSPVTARRQTPPTSHGHAALRQHGSSRGCRGNMVSRVTPPAWSHTVSWPPGSADGVQPRSSPRLPPTTGRACRTMRASGRVEVRPGHLQSAAPSRRPHPLHWRPSPLAEGRKRLKFNHAMVEIQPRPSVNSRPDCWRHWPTRPWFSSWARARPASRL